MIRILFASHHPTVLSGLVAALAGAQGVDLRCLSSPEQVMVETKCWRPHLVELEDRPG